MWPIVIAGGVIFLILIIIVSICIGVNIGKKGSVAVVKDSANDDIKEKRKIYCKNCGNLIKQNQKFCINCGAKIED